MNAWNWRITIGVISAACVLGFSTGAVADDPPDYGFDWVTIGAVGNRDTIPSEVPGSPTLEIGGVDYEYRIMRTEVTTTHWLEFVNAYAPYWDGGLNDPTFTGRWIWHGSNGHYIEPGAEQYPADAGWRVLARYVNWLHNDKINEQWAFEDGVYDTSTFGRDHNNMLTDQERHHPDAKFWIPTLDEWTKAMHYDTDRYGPGQEGYWMYPDGGMEPLIPGAPWDGGETNADTFPPLYLPVGSYTGVTSPWGLFDGSGGETEWLEDMSGTRRSRFARGSGAGDAGPDIFDRLDHISGGAPDGGGWGFRIVSVIPAPSTVAYIIVGVPFCLTRRSRR